MARRSDIDVDLIVNIVIDADIDVKIWVSLLLRGLEVLVGKVDDFPRGHHIVLVVYFGINERLFYLV